MRTTIITAVLVLTASCICADVARFDPPDPRLEKKVTLEETYSKLHEVAESLSRQSGVTVKAGTGERDWKVREQRVAVSAKDVPLGKALDQLTKLHSFYLSREGKPGEWSYTIWQDKKSRDLESEMLSAQYEADAQKATATRQAMMDAAKEAAGMTPEEAGKLRDKDPNLAYLGGTNTGRAYSQILNWLSGTDLDLMLRGRRVTIPFASLPPALQNAAMITTTSGIASLEKRDISDLTPLQLVISPLREDVAGELAGMGVGGTLSLMGAHKDGLGTASYDPILGAGEPMSIFLLSKPNSMFGKGLAQCLMALEDGMPGDQAEKMLMEALGDGQGTADAMAEAMADDSPTEKSPPTDPALLREVDLDKQIANIKGKDRISANAIAIDAVAKATGYAVMLECFPRPKSIADYLRPGKQPLYKLLVAMEKAGYTWKIENDTLRIRPRDWAIKRSYHVPENTILYWRNRLEKQGFFSLDDLAAIAHELTDAQIYHSLRTDPDVGYALRFPKGSDHELSLLRLYSTLSSSQKTAVSRGSGLRFSNLSDRQWDYLSPVIADRLGGISITDGYITNRPPDEGSPNISYFQVVVIGENQQEHTLPVRVCIAAREELAPMIEVRKLQREQAAQKAAQEPAQDATPVK